MQNRAWEQANKMQHCGLSKHFSSLYYLPVWTHTQKLCLYRRRGKTEKMQEKLLWLLEIPPLNKQSDYSIALHQKAALVIQSSLQNRLVQGLVHESLPLSSRDPCSRKYQSINDTMITSEFKKTYFKPFKRTYLLVLTVSENRSIQNTTQMSRGSFNQNSLNIRCTCNSRGYEASLFY